MRTLRYSPLVIALVASTLVPWQRTTSGVALISAADGLASPVALAFGPDDLGMFVVERAGRVTLTGPRGTRSSVLDLSDRVSLGAEQGLLGIALHPDYAHDRRLFLYYTDDRDTAVLSEFRVMSDGRRAIPDSERFLLRVPMPHEFHNGGGLAFGPDGLLYVGVGDGGGDGDPWHNGQDPGTLLGSILRIDINGAQPYGIPPDNPFADGGGAAEVYAFGLRNPWRFSFDRDTGDLWIADVGQASQEEIDRIRVGTLRATNFGWSVMEGNTCFRADACHAAGLSSPLATYGHDDGDCAVIGGFVYRGRLLPELLGQYVFGDYCSGRIRAYDPASPAALRLILDSSARITSFGEDATGEIYIIDEAGSVYLLAPETPLS